MILTMNLGLNSYDILVERDVLSDIGKQIPLHRKVLIVTDDGVPQQYANMVASVCDQPFLVRVPQGEKTKSFASFELLCRTMLTNGFTRTDAVVAVGGGVVGDLAGFASACFMRGIDFYNIPTTLLSQVDSSIGGKTAINLDEVKNCVGAFYQPKKVIIDPNVLRTLPKRQISNGLAEAIKMAVSCDRSVFERMEQEAFEDILDNVIVESLKIKKRVVEADEKEKSLRRVLNFGHTFGHGIETSMALHGLYHGECVALGMLPLCSSEVRSRLISVLKKAGLPTSLEFNVDMALQAVAHDKKLEGETIHYVFVPEVGKFEFRKTSLQDFQSLIKEAWRH